MFSKSEPVFPDVYYESSGRRHLGEAHYLSSGWLTILECYHLISDFCETTNTAPEDNNYHITKGLLVINDKIIDRVIPSSTLFYSEEMEEQIDYWEGKCLRD